MNCIMSESGRSAASLIPVVAAMTALASVFLQSPSTSAAVISFSGFSSDGHPVSATAEFTPDIVNDVVQVKLTNTTTATFDAGELFTGIDFNFGGLAATLLSDTGIKRTVAGSGAFSDTAVPQNLSWSLVPLAGNSFQLNFNPNAKDAILGPPSGGNYSGSNPSVRGNPGHNPYAAEMAVFTLGVPGLVANTPISVTAFRFGTDLNVSVIPEPTAWLITLLAVMTILCRRRAIVLEGSLR